MLVYVAFALTACGDDQARADFIAARDAQCKASNARTRKLNVQSAAAAEKARSEKELLRLLAPILARGYRQVSENAAVFEAAEPPAADAEEVKQIRRLYREQAKVVLALGATAKRGDVEAFRFMSERQKDVVARARQATRAYGFKVCGSSKSDAT